jgi:hypothetical protein
MCVFAAGSTWNTSGLSLLQQGNPICPQESPFHPSVWSPMGSQGDDVRKVVCKSYKMFMMITTN